MSPLVKTDEELLQLAQDIEADVENFEGGLIYQYYDKALEGIYLTDYPIFSHSCQLTSEEVIRTFTLLYSKGV